MNVFEGLVPYSIKFGELLNWARNKQGSLLRLDWADNLLNQWVFFEHALLYDAGYNIIKQGRWGSVESKLQTSRAR